MDGRGLWAQAGEYRRPREELEAAKAERRHYEELARQCNRDERQPQNFLGEGHTGSVAKSVRRPEPTPRAYRGARLTGQASCPQCAGIARLLISAGLEWASSLE